MIKIQIYIANFNLGHERYRSTYSDLERTDSAIPSLPLAPLRDLATSSSDHHGQDARNAVSSGPSSNENNTCMISFVLTLPFMSLAATTSC